MDASVAGRLSAMTECKQAVRACDAAMQRGDEGEDWDVCGVRCAVCRRHGDAHQPNLSTALVAGCWLLVQGRTEDRSPNRKRATEFSLWAGAGWRALERGLCWNADHQTPWHKVSLSHAT
jgi:hypothetical protein